MTLEEIARVTGTHLTADGWLAALESTLKQKTTRYLLDMCPEITSEMRGTTLFTAHQDAVFLDELAKRAEAMYALLTPEQRETLP